MPDIIKRLLKYGAPLREITTWKHQKERWYNEDEILVLLKALDEMSQQIQPLKNTIKQFEARSTEYLEIYKTMELELTYFKRKFPHPYPDELEELKNE
jgi:hypothetical protein